MSSARYLHIRWFSGKRLGTTHSFDTPPKQKGGATVVYFLNRKKLSIVVGIARCSSKDSYCRATGRKQALISLRDKPVVVPAEFFNADYTGRNVETRDVVLAFTLAHLAAQR
jgi:hypothetical protein